MGGVSPFTFFLLACFSSSSWTNICALSPSPGSIYLEHYYWRCFAFQFLLIGLFLILIMGHHMCTFTHLLEQSVFLLKAHGQKFINSPFLLMCVKRNFERTLLWRREFIMKCTRKALDISIFNDFTWAVMSLIWMICLNTPLIPFNFIMISLPLGCWSMPYLKTETTHQWPSLIFDILGLRCRPMNTMYKLETISQYRKNHELTRPKAILYHSMFSTLFFKTRE